MNHKVTILALMSLIPVFSTVSAQGIVVNRHSVAAFDSIPAYYKAQASALRMMFVDRSVRVNIDEGLTCLSYLHSNASNQCKRYIHTGVPPYSTDSSEVYWPGQWDNSN